MKDKKDKESLNEDCKFTKKEVIFLMESARDKGEKDGEIFWIEWLNNTFNEFNKIRQSIK